MAVALRGFTQMSAQSSSVSVAWPAGTVAGDLAVVVTNERSSLSRKGWTAYTEGVLCKIVTAADLVTPLWVDDTLAGLQTFSGARGIGATRYKIGSAGVTLSEAGGGLFVHGFSQKHKTTINPSSGRLGNTVQHQDYANAVWWQANTTTGYKSLSGTDDSGMYVAYELLPSKGPNPPSIVVPATLSYVDSAAAIALAWVHNSNSNSAQEQFKVKLTRVSTSAVVWLKADGTVTSTETAVTSAATTASINVGQLVTGQAYDLQVQTFDNGAWSELASKVRFTPLARPTVTSITVTSPVEDLSPALGWTMTAQLGAQTGWQAALAPAAHLDAANPTWLSPVTSGTDASTVAPSSTEWVNGADLYAWVRVRDEAQWSTWTRDDTTCKVSWTPPASPATVVVADGSPMCVTVTGVAVGADTLVVEWSDDDKATWKRLAVVTAPGGTEQACLPIAGFGANVWARARITATVGGVPMPSAWRESATATECTDRAAYLVSDTDTTDYLAVRVVSDGPRTLVQGVFVAYGLGAEVAMVDRSATMGQAGSTVLSTWTGTDLTELVAWLTGRDVFRIRWNPERDKAGVYTGVPALRVAVASPAAWQRLAQVDIAARHVSVDWVQQ